MPYSEAIARRVRTALAGHEGLIEKEMFGGIAFLLHGNMAVGVHGDDLIVRVDPEETDAILREPGARNFDLSPGGRAVKGWLMVAPKGFQTEVSFRAWVARGAEYASTLPKKAGKGASKQGRSRR